MIDKANVAVSGTFGRSSETTKAALLFDTYRDLLIARVQSSSELWKAPSGRASSRFTIETKADQQSTISHAKLTVHFARTEVDVQLAIAINPTRTLRHRFESQPRPTVDQLHSMSPEEFFASTSHLSPLRALDGSDNVLPDIAGIEQWLGPSYASLFMGIFDSQLRRWAMEAVAPHSEGFKEARHGNCVTAYCGANALTLRWSQLRVTYAEAYFERRHANAIDLMSRIEKQVTAGHSSAGWSNYLDHELGGRSYGSMVVGVGYTKRIQQVFYAKVRDRVRAEMRFRGGIRNVLRSAVGPYDVAPLADLFRGMGNEVAKRTRWEAFCSMAEEPHRALLHEVARMMAIIAECARSAKVDAEPLFVSLLTTGGIDESRTNGPTPRRLMRHLQAAGLIAPRSLKRRMQPGEQRRHRLTNEWQDIANRLQIAFDSQN